jgi:hypothetical protein
MKLWVFDSRDQPYVNCRSETCVVFAETQEQARGLAREHHAWLDGTEQCYEIDLSQPAYIEELTHGDYY